MRRPIATVLVGPSALLREGLARILGEVDFRVAASAPCVDDGILLAAPQDRPLLLIIDAGDDLRGVVPQVTLFKYLELVMLGETILPAKMLSLILDHTDDNQDNHPHGVLVPDARTSPEEYLEADIPDMPRLSDRERSILRYLIEGESNKAIARKIDIAEATVKVHVKAILRKIRVQNRTQAAIWAMSNASYISTISNGSVTSDKPAADPPPLAHTARNGGADRRYKLLNGVVNGDSLTDKIDPPVIAVPRRRDRG
jgi:two-component system nitrate/nitrite response regulator NarL